MCPNRGSNSETLPKIAVAAKNSLVANALLYVIRAPLGESAVSCVYAFLPGASQVVYEDMLSAVVRKGVEMGLEMEPHTTMTDFEQGPLNAISSQLGPHVETKGCFSRLTQSAWRKVQQLGLATHY